MNKEVPFNVLLGKTLVKFDKRGNEEIIFTCSDGSGYRMDHSQDCCEFVAIEDICGDPDLLIGETICQAEESTNNTDERRDTQEYKDKSFTWTFYRMATNRGSLVIRWYGTSNGYYSESVNFTQIN